MKRILYTAVTAGIICFSLAACNSNDNMNETGKDAADSKVAETDVSDLYTDDNDTIDWEDDPTIGKVQAGNYKLVGIVKSGETYEEMLKLREIENKGYLVVYDDGTAVSELDGEKTEYVYDEFNFYPAGDTERADGISYVFIGGRLVLNDGSTVTQYLKLTDEEPE